MADSLMPALERLSGLEAKGPVQVALQTREEVRAYVERRMGTELPPDVIEGMASAYVMLGLLPDTLDLTALLRELYAEQIAGYYDPESKKMYVLEGEPAETRTVLAHELAHALQDQNSDLDSLISRARGNDRQTAAQAALEGHATIVMLAAMTEQATARQIDPVSMPDPGASLSDALANADQFPVLQRAPRVIREALLFPYVDGARFVRELWKAAPAGAPRSAPLGPNLPQSTEQVLQPLERFITQPRDEPTELRFEETAGWETVFENTMGAFETGLFLQESLGTTLVAATGWDGDRYRVLRNEAGRALVWVSIWDDQASADRFAERVNQALAGQRLERAGRVEPFSLEGRPAVRVIIADSSVALPSVPAPAVSCADERGQRVSC
jgi:hypothetical protein